MDRGRSKEGGLSCSAAASYFRGSGGGSSHGGKDKWIESEAQPERVRKEVRAMVEGLERTVQRRSVR